MGRRVTVLMLVKILKHTFRTNTTLLNLQIRFKKSQIRVTLLFALRCCKNIEKYDVVTTINLNIYQRILELNKPDTTIPRLLIS